MSRLLPALPALALALVSGCAAATPLVEGIVDVRYRAFGSDPAWALAIGVDMTALERDGMVTVLWPTVWPRARYGIRTWRSPGRGTEIEARRGPCTARNGQVYRDHVRIRTEGLPELVGCGGWRVRG